MKDIFLKIVGSPMLVGCALLVLLLLTAVLYVVFFHKPRAHHRRRSHHWSGSKETGGKSNPPPSSSEKRKWRLRRRSRFSLNPTLAQTRGLPPVRDEKQSPPAPPY